VSRCTSYAPITEGYISSFGIPKVDDVVDWNSCHMRSVRPSHEFGNLWAFLGVTMKVLEVPKSPWIQGFWSDGPGEASNTIYWPETLFFRGTTHSYEFTSPWLPSPRGRAPLQYQVDPRKKKVKGLPLPTGRHPLGHPPGCRRRLLGHGRRGCRISPLGRHISINIYNTSSSSLL
jgi:hypothetical protein